MLNQLVIFAFCVAAAVYAHSNSNKTIIDEFGSLFDEPEAEILTSTETETSAEIETATMQLADKSALSQNDDNFGMIGSGAETVRNAASAAGDTFSDAADSASKTASNIAKSVSNHVSDAATAVKHEASGIIKNGTSTSFVATSFIILGLFVNTMLFA